MEVGIRVTPFNARLRRARHRAGLMQAQIAAIVGVSQSHYSAIERFCRSVDEEEATEIALVLGYEVDYLFPAEARNFKSVKARSVEFVYEACSLAEAQHLALPSPEDEYVCEEARVALGGVIESLLADLTYRQERVIRLRFGLGGCGAHVAGGGWEGAWCDEGESSPSRGEGVGVVAVRGLEQWR